MNKRYILFNLFLLAILAAKAQSYLECDFKYGIPDDYILIDNDNNNPSASMANMGFTVGKAWIAAIPNGESQPAACSTSWYSPAGTADDWMITPLIEVKDENAILSWRAKAGHKQIRDGYMVCISESEDADMNTFTQIFDIAAEEANWTYHTIDLSAYKGKSIRVAFVNNSTDKSYLFISNIYIGAKTDVFMKCSLNDITALTGGHTVSGKVYTRNTGTENYTIGLEYNGNTYTEDFTAALGAGEEMEFTLSNCISIGWYETVPYKLWVKNNNGEYMLEQTITSYPRKVVCDDVTGTWCGYCIRGIVALDNLRENYADRAIGIAVHQGDVMMDQVTGYGEGLSRVAPWSGLPAGSINRSRTCDPGNFERELMTVFNAEKIYVAMSVEAEHDIETRTVRAKTGLWFAADHQNEDLRLAYVVIENRVHQPGNSLYNQKNYYSGGGYGPMGGYENLPEIIPSDMMYYDEVVRAYVEEFNGIAYSVPENIFADDEITHEIEFTLTDNILVDANTELIVMLIDQKDKHVVNAEKIKLGEADPTGVILYPNNINITETTRYNIQGIQQAQPVKGLNIIRYSDGTIKKEIIK